MGYATLPMVKERLGFDVTDATSEEELKRAIAYADGFADNAFAAVGQSVPSTVPQPIQDGCADIAAFYFLRNRNPTKASTFYDSGKMFINGYIKGQYKRGVAKRHGSEHFERT